MAKRKRFPHQFTTYIRSHWKDASTFKLVWKSHPGAEWAPAGFEFAVPDVLAETAEERIDRETLDKPDAKKFAELFREQAEEWGMDVGKRADYAIVATYFTGDEMQPSHPAYRYDPVYDDAEDTDDDKGSTVSEAVAILRESKSLFSTAHKWMKEQHALNISQLRSMYDNAQQATDMMTKAAQPLLEWQKAQLEAQTEMNKAETFNATLMEAVQQFGPAAQTWASAEYVKAQQRRDEPDAEDENPVRVAFLALAREMTDGERLKLAQRLDDSARELLAELLDNAHSMDVDTLTTHCRKLLAAIQSAHLSPSDFRMEILSKAMALKKAVESS